MTTHNFPMDMVRILFAAHEATVRTARKLIPLVDKANDSRPADTAHRGA